MEFTFVTDHDQRSFTILAKVLRKTTRSALSTFSRATCGIFIAMLLSGILVMRMSEDRDMMKIEALLMGFSSMLVFVVFIVVFIVFYLSGVYDYWIGFLGRKQMQPGTEKSTAVFYAEGYTILTNVAKTEFRYDSMLYISETMDYFVFVLGKNHAQIFNKSSISGGTVEDFRVFIEERTNKKLLSIKG